MRAVPAPSLPVAAVGVRPLAGRSLRLRWTPDVHRDAMLVIGLVIGLSNAVAGVFDPVDATNYWAAGTSTMLYPARWSEVGAGYLFYPPPVAQLSALLQPIGWQAFITLWTVVTFGAMWYCARRWSLALLAIGIPHYLNLGPPELAVFLDYALLGNVQWLLAALCVVALRRPALWSVMLFTKVTGAIGWWWHVVRGEWRAAVIAALAAGGAFAVSFLIAPQQWLDYAAFVANNYTMANGPIAAFPIPLGIRLPTALILVVWGARTSRAWTLPIAVGWALPALFGLGFLPFWVAALQLRGWRAPSPKPAHGPSSEVHDRGRRRLATR